jgi:hypothetical protein
MLQLSNESLRYKAPSVFAVAGSEKMSDRYGFIPTIDCIDGLRDAGFYPVEAMQSKARSADKKQHTKHLIRFRKQDYESVDGNFPEIVMVNSHDGSTSYQLRAGVYRLVCSNGMVVGNDYFTRRIKHQGDVVEKVVNAANDLIEISPLSVQRIQEWGQLELSRDQKISFAEQAILLKWDSLEAVEPLNFSSLSEAFLQPKRIEDRKSDLWSVFNVIQENMIRGGIRYSTPTVPRQRTRSVRSVAENVRINTSLWALAEKFEQSLKH